MLLEAECEKVADMPYQRETRPSELPCTAARKMLAAVGDAVPSAAQTAAFGEVTKWCPCWFGCGRCRAKWMFPHLLPFVRRFEW